ncbi:hypothetical protein LX32DRAFT_457892 [Colletotrichum zoysiae]|uniref:Secreted protein n=1 Tax=Colletotrichum zoysiae TaxID=1216348 RepID=A0AAD9HEV2_9PEZI|nr:hypothetical protein LX32DRAFT_457892 [Colletotrichum zoysiae]
MYYAVCSVLCWWMPLVSLLLFETLPSLSVGSTKALREGRHMDHFRQRISRQCNGERRSRRWGFKDPQSGACLKCVTVFVIQMGFMAYDRGGRHGSELKTEEEKKKKRKKGYLKLRDRHMPPNVIRLLTHTVGALFYYPSK